MEIRLKGAGRQMIGENFGKVVIGRGGREELDTDGEADGE
jgi:hypothetical protein